MLGRRSSVAAVQISARCVVHGGSRSLRLAVGAVASSLGAVAVARCSRHLPAARNLPAALAAASPGRRQRHFTVTYVFGQLGAARSARRLAPSTCDRWRGRFLSELVAVAQHSRRRCLRRRAGAPGPGLVVPRRSRRRGTRSPCFRGGGSLFRRVHTAQRLALSACGRWCGRYLPGGGRGRAAFRAPLTAALRWRSWRRLNRAAALAAV